MYSLTQTVAPTVLAVSRATAKTYLRVLTTDHDDELDNVIIPAAIDVCEQETNRQFATATWQLGLSDWPPGRVFLPKGELQSITSFTYVDSDGDSQTLTTDDYILNTTHEPGYLVPAAGTVWPIVYDYGTHPITITYTCGYGTQSDLPGGLLNAVLMQIAHSFDMRVPVVTGTIATEIPRTIKHLLGQYALGDGYTEYGN